MLLPTTSLCTALLASGCVAYCVLSQGSEDLVMRVRAVWCSGTRAATVAASVTVAAILLAVLAAVVQ
jgi:hypothetical protein